MTDRKQNAYKVRVEAAEMARSRDHATQTANGDEQRFAGDCYFMSFTKGLPHNPDTGLLHDPRDFVQFRRAIDEGFVDPFTANVRHGAAYEVTNKGGGKYETLDTPEFSGASKDFRQWEAPTAGVAYDLEGPDCQAVTMAPAPSLLDEKGEPNPELVFEMAEVYELALLRDVHFSHFEKDEGGGVGESIKRLNALDYAGQGFKGRPRKTGKGSKKGQLTGQTVFRGSSPGVDVGPYLSQFMLIGNGDFEGTGSVADGKISYGAIQIDQKVPVAVKGKNFMQTMSDYVEVQRGLAPDPVKKGFSPLYETSGNPKRAKRRFICTPRDFATYVHFDALYEAYLNACLILLGMKTPFDPAFDHLSGVGAGSGNVNTRRNAGGFALYGGPHILTLVTEVATRALKAVRFQKFNNHIRLRPEALAQRLELARRVDNGSLVGVPNTLYCHMKEFAAKLQANKSNGGKSTLDEIAALNQVPSDKDSFFLPMAFPEGSPMHPSYGAGHATVAGACVTILKAFFDTSTVLVECVERVRDEMGQIKKNESGEVETKTSVAFRRLESCNGEDIVKVSPIMYRPSTDGTKLDDDREGEYLTLEGELNKLAANISIARNMAGVHYFSDYYDSLRMGEEVAIGILEEQALTYPTDPFVLSLPTFDGGVRRIGKR